MSLTVGNLFADLPQSLPDEQFDVLIESGAVKIERIVSTGQASPPGDWWDQTHDEWVTLLRGQATLKFEGEATPRILKPGDWLIIPAHVRHRVESTSADEPTVWLAMHYPAADALKA
jgi:cupin 2 domain-containing protein